MGEKSLGGSASEKVADGIAFVARHLVNPMQPSLVLVVLEPPVAPNCRLQLGTATAAPPIGTNVTVGEHQVIELDPIADLASYTLTQERGVSAANGPAVEVVEVGLDGWSLAHQRWATPGNPASKPPRPPLKLKPGPAKEPPAPFESVLGQEVRNIMNVPVQELVGAGRS